MFQCLINLTKGSIPCKDGKSRSAEHNAKSVTTRNTILVRAHNSNGMGLGNNHFFIAMATKPTVYALTRSLVITVDGTIVGHPATRHLPAGCA